MTKKIKSLSLAKENTTVMLVSIEGGKRLHMRMNDMGLKKDAKITVLHSRHPGPCVIRVGSTRLVIGHGMAHKIMVKESPE